MALLVVSNGHDIPLQKAAKFEVSDHGSLSRSRHVFPRTAVLGS